MLTLVCEEVCGSAGKDRSRFEKDKTNDKHKTMTWGYTT